MWPFKRRRTVSIEAVASLVAAIIYVLTEDAMPIDTSKLNDTLDQLLKAEDALSTELGALIADILALRTNTDGATLQTQIDALQAKAATALGKATASVSQVSAVEPAPAPAQEAPVPEVTPSAPAEVTAPLAS